jgi:hypothetical protein
MNTIFVANLCCSADSKSTTRIVKVIASEDGSKFHVHITGNTIERENGQECFYPFCPSPVEHFSRREALASAQAEVNSLLEQQFVYCEDADPIMKQWRMDNVEARQRMNLLETQKEQANDPAVKWERTQQQHSCMKQIAETDEKIKQRKKDIGFAFDPLLGAFAVSQRQTFLEPGIAGLRVIFNGNALTSASGLQL